MELCTLWSHNQYQPLGLQSSYGEMGLLEGQWKAFQKDPQPLIWSLEQAL